MCRFSLLTKEFERNTINTVEQSFNCMELELIYLGKNNNPCEFCEQETVHEDILEKVRAKMPDDQPLYEVAEIFKVFGDLTRSKIISALTISEMCVCDIAELLGMTSSAISHQLRILKQARVVRSRREGKTVFYKLDDDHIEQIFHIAFEHVNEE